MTWWPASDSVRRDVLSVTADGPNVQSRRIPGTRFHALARATAPEHSAMMAHNNFQRVRGLYLQDGDLKIVGTTPQAHTQMAHGGPSAGTDTASRRTLAQAGPWVTQTLPMLEVC